MKSHPMMMPYFMHSLSQFNKEYYNVDIRYKGRQLMLQTADGLLW
jgi:hypothetical protein